MPVYEMGRMAAEILLQQIVDGTRENEEIKVKGEKILAANSIRAVSRDKAA
jgi:DNA-binding LacI/PurR family transcriptional regulator